MFREIVKEKIDSVKNKIKKVFVSIKNSFIDFVKVLKNIITENKDNKAILCWFILMGLLAFAGLCYISFDVIKLGLFLVSIIFIYVLIYSIIKYYKLNKASLDDYDYTGDN